MKAKSVKLITMPFEWCECVKRVKRGGDEIGE